jgi:hypothetical protein
VDVGATALYAHAMGHAPIGTVPRLARSGRDIYLERLSSTGTRVQVRIDGPSALDGAVGWVDEDAIESAGEKCPGAYANR